MDISKQLADKSRKKLIASWVAVGVSVCVSAIGAVALGSAESNKSTAAIAGAILLVCGAVALLVSVVLAVIMRKDWHSLTAISDNVDHNVWIRWTCSPTEYSRFISSEAARVKLTAKRICCLFLGAIALGFVLLVLAEGREAFDPATFLIGEGAVVSLFSLGFALSRAENIVQLHKIRKRAGSEVILAGEGIIWGDFYLAWRRGGWGLMDVTYEAGDPDVLSLAFLTGGGSAASQAELRASYDLDATLGKYRTQFITNLRLPVTAGIAEQVRKLAATAIERQLLAPRLSRTD